MVSNNEVILYFESAREPLPMNYISDSVKEIDTIIAAINPRATEEVIQGILRACKKSRSVVIFELALSEMSLSGGYTGYTPKKFAERCKSAAEKEKWFGYALHADHLTVKKGTEEEMANVMKEIEARVESGFTGFRRIEHDLLRSHRNAGCCWNDGSFDAGYTSLAGSST